jgi:hypothetical protein
MSDSHRTDVVCELLLEANERVARSRFVLSIAIAARRPAQCAGESGRPTNTWRWPSATCSTPAATSI